MITTTMYETELWGIYGAWDITTSRAVYGVGLQLLTF